MDVTCPAFEVLPRAGRTKLEIVLTAEAAAAANPSLPQPPSPDEEPSWDLTFPVDFGGVRYEVYVRKRPLLADETKGPRPDFDVLSTASEEVGASLIVHCHVTPLLTPRFPVCM